jgi:hypothetical protein
MWKSKEKSSKYDEAIDRLLGDMKRQGPDNLEYSAMLTYLERLNKLKAEEKKAERRVSPDTMAIVAGNLVGILIIVMYEQKHVLTSKSLNFIQRNPNNP